MSEIVFSCKSCLSETEKEFERMNASRYAKISSIGLNLFSRMYISFHKYHEYKEPPCAQ